MSQRGHLLAEAGGVVALVHAHVGVVRHDLERAEWRERVEDKVVH